ncbi:hypothetical protein ACFE04_025095 [Oxalis oulophora]
MEENITWERIRAPPFDITTHVLHISDCLHDLKPGDHIEIQWRRNNDISYGEPIWGLNLLVDKKRYIIVAECFTDAQVIVAIEHLCSLQAKRTLLLSEPPTGNPISSIRTIVSRS